VHEFAVELQRASADAIRVNAQFLAETDSRKPVGRSAERCIQEVAFVEGLAPRLPIAGMGLQGRSANELGVRPREASLRAEQVEAREHAGNLINHPDLRWLNREGGKMVGDRVGAGLEAIAKDVRG
jgi:hypothetical protein